MPTLHILSGDDGSQRRAWIDLLDSTPEVEPFAHPAYLDLFASESDRPFCGVMTSGESVVIFPFLRRSLHGLPGVPGELSDRADICAPPHGWGGPWVLAASGDRDGLVTDFYTGFAEWAAGEGIVSDYHTFDPLEKSEDCYPGEVQVKLPIVIRSLDLDDEAMWSDFDAKVRNNVRRARKSLTVEFDEDGRELQAFLDIHKHTMERRGAAPRYRFTRSFFEHVVAGLSGRFVFVHVRHGDEIVSTELDLLSQRCVYSFAGGTRADAFPLRPNDLLKHELIRWARSRGAKSLVLGGGVAGADNLFRYKRSFAPSGTRQLMIGRWIMDGEAYDSLVSHRDRWQAQDTTGFFPAYRAP